MSSKTEKGTVAIQSLLGASNGVLANFHKRVAEISLLQEKLKAILSPPLCNHFVLANNKKGVLTLHTDSPAWAARLRFKTPDILHCIQELCDVEPPKSIRIKVLPPVSESTSPARTIKLSNKNAQLIQDTANSIVDPVLRAALIRLSQGKS